MADDAIKRLIELGINADPALRALDALGEATKKQTKGIDDMTEQVKKLGDTLKEAFTLGALTEGLTSAVEKFRSITDSLEQFGKTAQVIGVTAAQLSQLQYGFKLSGVNADDSARIMTRFAEKLGNMGDETLASTKILKGFGITAGEDTQSAFLKWADGMAHATDNANKTASAAAIVGKNMVGIVIPAMKDGAQGFHDAATDLDKFNLTVTDESVEAAKKFNEQMTSLQALLGRFAVDVTKELLPVLNEITKALVTNIEKLGLFAGAIKTAQDLIDVSDSTRLAKAALEAQDAVDKLTKKVKEADASKFPTFGIQQTKADLVEATAIAKNALDAYNAFQKAAAAQATKPKPEIAQTDIGSPPKGGAAQKTEFELWLEAIQKGQTALDDVPKKIATLDAMMAKLAKTTGDGTEQYKKLAAERDKLLGQTTQFADLAALDKQGEAMDQIPVEIDAINRALVDFHAKGLDASNTAVLYRQKLLDLQAVTDPAASVQKDLTEQTKQRTFALAKEAEVYTLLAKNMITVAQANEELNKLGLNTSKNMDDAANKAQKLSDELAASAGKFMTNFVDTMIDGFGKASESFGSMVESFLKDIAKLMVSKEMEKLAGMFTDSAKTAGGWGALFSNMFSSASAQGHAWAGPSGVEAMATGGILGGPTFFSSGGRMAVAGEAGPEAVVPLQRTAGGDLGVAASPVTVNVINNADAKVTTQTADNADGSKQIDIYIERKVKDMMASGSMDRTMRSSFGLTRQPSIG